jgi:hypothetical protein
MKSSTKRVTVGIILAIILIISLYFVVLFTIKAQNQAVISQHDTLIKDQEILLASLADSTRRNGADEATARIIKDCAPLDRARFDSLLDLLSSTISLTELAELNTLFYKCGSFFSDSKAVMATKLAREVDIYSKFLNLRSIVSNENTDYTEQLAAWRNLSEAEIKTAEYFNQLVVLQGTIISELIAGKSATSPSVVATLNEVNAVRGQMTILSSQIEVEKAKALAL